MNKNNNVEHPSHYNREGAIECIEEMILAFGKEKVADFCLCNAWKYRYRAADKNGIEDLKKSDWYMKKYKELTQSCISISLEECKEPMPNCTTIDALYKEYNMDKEE